MVLWLQVGPASRVRDKLSNVDRRRCSWSRGTDNRKERITLNYTG